MAGSPLGAPVVAGVPANADKLDVLAQVFGYHAFRPGQEGIVDALLSGRDVLAVMPTGAGKSLTYQLPALMMPGLTIVVSPLLSLMADQVFSLKDLGVPAAYLNSTLSPRARAEVLRRAEAGWYRIMYVAPERLADPSFQEFSRRVRIPLVAVDEAHCVSQWGHDFRPAYLQIADFVASLPQRPPVAALTATATAPVREDIRKRLALRRPYQVVTGFDRPNLSLGVKHCRPSEKPGLIEGVLRRHAGESGIVYCSTRKAVDELTDELVADGFSAVRYRAGIPDAERAANQDAFERDDVPIIVATNAFGMGIDKSNVRFVVHNNMPKNLESYYQEAGRAGRDGEPAECLLLYSPRDVQTARFLIENGVRPDASGEGDEAQEAHESRVRNDLRLLDKMVGYCTTTECLRSYILDYFGEPRRQDGCGNCSNCAGTFESTDITAEAHDVLACVRELGWRHFGKSKLADILRGADTKDIRDKGLDGLASYGLLQDRTASEVKDVVSYMVDNGYLAQEGGQYPVIAEGPRASELDAEGTQVSIRTEVSQAAPRKRTSSGKAAVELSELGQELFERLRTLRKQLADEQGVPPYVVFNDKTLTEMCVRCPMTDEELLAVSGVGRTKLNRYGEAFMREIASFSMETGYGGATFDG